MVQKSGHRCCLVATDVSAKVIQNKGGWVENSHFPSPYEVLVEEMRILMKDNPEKRLYITGAILSHR